MSEHPLTYTVLRVSVADVRYPSAALMYTAPPIPFCAVHSMNEHSLSNTTDDPSLKDAAIPAPFPSLKDTLSIVTPLNDRLVPDRAVMSE